MKITNKNAQQYVQNRQEFTGSNLYAKHMGRDTTENERYVVYSYGRHFPIYIYTVGQWFANSDKYSRTTTRHQSQARPIFDGSLLHWLPADWMVALAERGYAAIAQRRLNGEVVK